MTSIRYFLSLNSCLLMVNVTAFSYWKMCFSEGISQLYTKFYFHFAKAVRGLFEINVVMLFLSELCGCRI